MRTSFSIRVGIWIMRFVGITLICLGIGVVYFWFCFALPLLRRFDENWKAQFTERAKWEAMQNDIFRSRWMHDDAWSGGDFGDEELVAWLMEKIEPGDDVYDCFSGHKQLALVRLTGQDPTHGREIGAASAWLQWWEGNKHKSQIEWIRDGLAQYGATVHNPPSPSEQESLLIIVGGGSLSDPDTSGILIEESMRPDLGQEPPPTLEELRETPEFKQRPYCPSYGAFRWLRDTGFSPVDFMLSRGDRPLSEDVARGLRVYYEWISSYSNDCAGKLAFEERVDDSNCRPWLLFPERKALVYSLMIGPPLCGVVLLALTWRWSRPITRGEDEATV